MQLQKLLEKLNMGHLSDTLDTLCEQAGKNEPNYREFLQKYWLQNGQVVIGNVLKAS